MDRNTNHKPLTKSKLDQFSLGFELNRSIADERKMTKKRTDFGTRRTH